MKIRIFLFLFIALSCNKVFAATDYAAIAAAAYEMDEDSGTLDDSSPNTNTCTASGTPGTYNVAGKFDEAFDFTEAANTSFGCGSDASIDDLTSITLAAWMAPDTDGNNDDSVHAGVIISKADGWTNGWGFANRNSPGSLIFGQKFSGGRGNWRSPGSVIAYDGTFQHVAVTFDGSSATNDPIFYVGGVLKTTTELNTPSGSRDSDASYNMILGLEATGTNVGELDARLDEILVYGGILNSTQINELLNSGLDGTHGVVTRRRMAVAG